MTRSSRQKTLKAITDQAFDVLVIGGGINGVSTFRELALNGVSVLLVDSKDYCAGASAAPSRLAHGGIKYLENGEFRLVAEATHERNRLLQNAAHVIKPLPCTMPFESWFGGLFSSAFKFFRLPGAKFQKRGVVVVKLGLMIYDWMGRKQRTMPTHQFRWRSDSHKTFNGLDPKVIATATYYDALITQPERLCLELVTDTLAECEQPCKALSYASVTGSESEWVMIQDGVTGENVKVKPQLVVNAAGPWIDKVNGQLGVETHYIGGSKGSHLVLDHPELAKALAGNMLYFETGDNRLCLAYPIGDRVLMGTTDLRIDDPDLAVCEDAEVDYILDVVAQMLPGISINRKHIVYTYTGVRPLPNDTDVGVGKVSRDHSIEIDEADANRPFAITSLVGGKWTTFRAFGELTADRVMQRLAVTRHRDTHNLGIGGGRDYPAPDKVQTTVNEIMQRHKLPEQTSRQLLERYGMNERVFESVAAGNARQPLTSIDDYRVGEIHYLCEKELVTRLEDLVYRRTTIALEGFASDEVLEELASLAAPILGWDTNTRNNEVEQCKALLKISVPVA